jgi:hypothetical protein
MDIKLSITVAIGAGLIAGIIVIALMQFLNGLLLTETDQTAELIGLLIAFGAGSLTAGAVARFVSEHVTPLSATICGIILMLLGFANLFMVEHPLWFAISSTLVYIPAAWFGAWMVKFNR